MQEPRPHPGGLPGTGLWDGCMQLGGTAQTRGSWAGPCTGCPSTPAAPQTLSLTPRLWDTYILEGKHALTATAQSSGRTEASDPCARVGTVARGWPQHGGRAPSEKRGVGGPLLAASPAMAVPGTPPCGAHQNTAGPMQGDLKGRWGPGPPQWGPSRLDHTHPRPGTVWHQGPSYRG